MIEKRRIIAILGNIAALAVLNSALPLTASVSVNEGKSVIEGPARVIDGDTLQIAGHRIRLEGIDAPEHRQTCGRGLQNRWPCGTAAKNALSEMVAGKILNCHKTGTDRYGRILAICHVGSIDTNAAMVQAGLAWAYIRYSQRYAAIESEARAARRGIWRTYPKPAWTVRAENVQRSHHPHSQACVLKGNISRSGHVYHLPGTRYYDRVKIDVDSGERWFCSISDALEAGWRPASDRE